jgi:hypothetical protein
MTIRDRVTGYPEDIELQGIIDHCVHRHDRESGPLMIQYYTFNEETHYLTREWDGEEFPIGDFPLKTEVFHDAAVH